MTSLIFHPTTLQQLEDFINKPSHALILSGPRGSGKKTIARHVGTAVLGKDLETYPYLTTIAPIDAKAIGIEPIRELEKFLSLKVPNNSDINRLVIISDAHTMTAEAQNALLKMLEEPPRGTLLILTASNEQDLLPTVRSRAQTISIKKPDKLQLEDYFTDKGQPMESINRIHSLSGGLTGLMHGLLDDQDHPLMQATEQARAILSMTTYERLLAVDALSKNRQLAIDTAFILQQMANISLRSASGATSDKWQKVLTSSYRASEALKTNALTKLVLTDLMLSI